MLIRIAADTSKLRSEMEEAKKTVAFSADGMKKAADAAKFALGGLMGIASIAAFKGMVDAVIEGQGAMHDLAQSTGLSVAALGQFKSVGALTGTSAESIAGAVTKLSKNFASLDDEGKGAAVALKALGINFDEFKNMSPEERMLAVAKSMSGFKDGADKSAAAMMLFGKEGAKLVPYLNDLGAEADEIAKKLTDQEKAAKAAGAAMADAYGDNLVKIKKESEGWKKDVAMGLLPVMYETSEVFLKMSGGAGGLKEKISQLAKDGTFAEWGRNLLTIFSYVIDVVQVLWRVVESVVKFVTGYVATVVASFSGIGDALAAFAKGDFKGAMDAMGRAGQEVKTITVAAGESIMDTWSTPTMGATFRARMADMKGVQATSGDTRKEMSKLSDVIEQQKEAQKRAAEAEKEAEAARKAHTQAVKSQMQALDKLGEAVEAKNETLRRELALGRELTPVEKELVKLDEELAKAKKIMSAAEYEAAEKKAQTTRQSILAGQAIEDEVLAMREWKKEREAAFATVDKTIQGLKDETAKQHEANETVLLSKEALLDRRVSRLLDLAAQADAIAQDEEERAGCTKLSAQQRELAEAYRKSADEARTTAHVEAAKAARDEWQKSIESLNNGLTDALMRAFESGKGFADAFKQTLVNAFKTMVLQPVIKAIIQPVGNALGSLLGGGDAAGMAGGSGGGLGSLMSMGSNLWNGAKSLFNGSDILGSSAGSWMTDFGSSVGTATSKLGGFLFDNGFEGLGNFIGGNQGLISDIAGIGGDAMGYLGAFKNAANGKWGSAIGSGVGTFFGGPIGGAIGNFIGGAVDKLFGGDGKDYYGADYMRSSKATAGYRPGEYEVGDRQYGWSVTGARSDKVESALKGITDASIGAISSLQAAFGNTSDFKLGTYFSANGDVSQGNIKLMRDGQTLAATSSGSYGSDGEAAFKAYATDVAKTVRSAIDGIGLPSWASGMLDKLGSAPSIEELVATVGQIASMQRALTELPKALNPLGGVFSTIASASAGARENLVSLAGGVQNLMAASKQFVADYYTGDEKAGIAARDAMDALKALGIDGSKLTSREDFRALVESLGSKIEDATAQKQLVGLLALGPQFAQVADYLKEQGKTLADAAAAAPQTAILSQILNPTQTTAEAVTGVADKLDTSNVKLEGIIAAVREGNGSIGGFLSAAIRAIDAVGAAVSNGNAISAAANKKLDELAADGSLGSSKPTYRYDVGGA